MSIIQNAANRRWSERQAELAYKRQVEQWRRENAYNSPSAIVARLKAAGINVNSAFDGSGYQMTGSHLPGVSQANAPQQFSVADAMSSMIGAGAQRMNAGTTRERARVQNALDVENIQHVRALVRDTTIDAASKEVLYKYLDESEALRLANLSEQINLTKSQKEFVDKQISTWTARVAAEINERNANSRQLEKMIEKMGQEIMTSASLEALNREQLEYIKGVAIANAISNAVGAVGGVATSAARYFTPAMSF